MMNRRLMALIGSVALLLVMVLPVAAAPAYSGDSVYVPGWVGGALTALSIVLAVGVSFWMRSQKK